MGKRVEVLILTIVVWVMTTACGMNKADEHTNTTAIEIQTEEITTQLPIVKQSTSSEVVSTEQNVTVTEHMTEEVTTQGAQSEEQVTDVTSTEQATDQYIGTYNDYDNNEPSLTISLNTDGSYHVQMEIFRLTSLDDGVGSLTDRGLEFVATDAAGNPIKGLITLEGNEAVVTFTDSTWELITNGDSYRYVRAN
ncbi:MAG: hypothetical protein IJP29_02810 [Lachnospiraceae bacterium]|nr:hypothetical protein [Lachnospiraceae bacterium]